MFRIVFYVEDRHLAAVMHTLAGQAKGLEVVPVANAVSDGSKVKAKVNGNVVELFADYMKKHSGKINSDYMREFQKSIGRSPEAYSNVLHKAKLAKLIRQIGTGSASTYERIGK